MLYFIFILHIFEIFKFIYFLTQTKKTQGWQKMEVFAVCCVGKAVPYN